MRSNDANDISLIEAFEADRERLVAVQQARSETQRGVYDDLRRLQATLVEAAEDGLAKDGLSGTERFNLEHGRSGLLSDLDHVLDQLIQMEALLGSADLACEVASELRHVIGGAFLIGAHGALTDEVRRRFRLEATASAHAGRKATTTKRVALAKPVFAAAPRKADGSLLNRAKVAEQLALAFGVKGVSAKTLRTYEAACASEKKQ